ncbi:MAG: phosphoribulokinase [Rhodospirillales bacterium]|nr:MAG: phosphoribulokinase [Rhodospirillales bacterium]
MDQLTSQDYRPVVIGIVGDSGAGKTTLAAGLAEALGRERTLVICTDDYHRQSRAERARLGVTPHDPACNYMDILEQHIDLLRAGEPVLKPVYNHRGGVLDPPEYVTPKPFIILEGLLGYSSARLRDAYDIKLYLEPRESLRTRWKFQRDITLGAYTVEQVMASLERLNADSRRFIIPQRGFADMVVNFYPPDDDPEETGGRLNAVHILRPTLPYLDLTPVLEAGQGRFVLELARDVDGRPVDALHILGAMDEPVAQTVEAALQRLIPAPSPVDDGLGRFVDADGNPRRSHPLALSQLLVTHYLLNAAVSHIVPAAAGTGHHVR